MVLVNQHPNFTHKILGYLKGSNKWVYSLCKHAYNNLIIKINYEFHDFK